MLTLTDTTQSAVMKLAEGNPGALRVCCELANREHGIMHLLHLDDMGMRGPSIWMGYKDFAGENLDTFVAAIQARDPAMVQMVNARGGKAWSGGKS